MQTIVGLYYREQAYRGKGVGDPQGASRNTHEASMKPTQGGGGRENVQILGWTDKQTFILWWGSPEKR